MYKSRQIFTAAQVKIISKTNGLLPLALVTKWVVEMCSPEQLKGAVVGLEFLVVVGGVWWYVFCLVGFFLPQQNRTKYSYSDSVLTSMSGGRFGVVIREEYL